MAIVSRKEAGELTGKSHATIYRHLRSGKLSKMPDGGIDTAELLRVYGAFVSGDETKDTTYTPEPIRADIEQIYQKDKSDIELKLMREQIDLLKQQLAKTETLLEHSQEQGDKFLQIIGNQLPPPDDGNSVLNILKKKFL